MNITIENVSMKFKENKALDNVSFEIGEGIFGLLGENGAGKTTLMRILITLLEPTEGSVTICGQKLCAANREEIKKLIGYLPQELGLYPSLTVRETLDYLGGLCGLKNRERKERIDMLLDQTHMLEHQNKKNRQLSGGMKRRVGLMQAMLTDPKVLIVDEPTTGLDPEERIRIRNLLSDFSRDRIVLFSTHVVEDLSATCFKLGVLKRGKVIYQGTLAVLTAIYVIAGGYMATAVNDFIQGIIMLFGIVTVIVAVIRNKGGFMAAYEGLARITDPAVTETPGIFASFFGPDPLNLLFVVILTSLGTWGLPQMVQKFYAIKNEESIKKGTIISTLFALVVAGGCYFLGGFGRLFSDRIDIAANGYDSVIPTMLQNLGPVLIALVVILVLSASMSTLSSLVIASSSTLTIDFLKETFLKKLDDKKQLLLIRILVVVFIAISAILALIQYKSSITFIAQLMGISWGALAGAFLAPFLYALYWKKTTKAACWTCFIFGSGLMLVEMAAPGLLPAIMRNPINCGAIAMLAGLVLVPVVSLVTPKPDQKLVEETFACYNKETMVKQSTALGK